VARRDSWLYNWVCRPLRELIAVAKEVIVRAQLDSPTTVEGPTKVLHTGFEDYTTFEASIAVGHYVYWDSGTSTLKRCGVANPPVGIAYESITGVRCRVQTGGIFTAAGTPYTADTTYELSTFGAIIPINGDFGETTIVVGRAIDTNKIQIVQPNLAVDFPIGTGSASAHGKLLGLMDLMDDVSDSSGTNFINFNDGMELQVDNVTAAVSELTLTDQADLNKVQLGLGFDGYPGGTSLVGYSNPAGVSATAAVIKRQNIDKAAGDGPRLALSLNYFNVIPINQTLGSITAEIGTTTTKGELVFSAGTAGTEEFLRLNEVGNLEFPSGSAFQIRSADNAAHIDINTTGPVITIKGDTLPEGNGTRDLGASLLRWKDFYVENFIVQGLHTYDAGTPAEGWEARVSATHSLVIVETSSTQIPDVEKTHIALPDSVVVGLRCKIVNISSNVVMITATNTGHSLNGVSNAVADTAVITLLVDDYIECVSTASGVWHSISKGDRL
jgi:hypothetical protein